MQQRYKDDMKPVEPYRHDFLQDFEPIDESFFGGMAFLGCAMLIVFLAIAYAFGIEL